LPLGAPGSWLEIGEQLLIVYGLHRYAPESIRTGAIAGALAAPVTSIIGKLMAGNSTPQGYMPPLEIEGNAGQWEIAPAAAAPPALPMASDAELSYWNAPDGFYR
jgi:hypothetical protein